MTSARISILMPLRNEQEHLGAALQSLQRQTLRDWELIAVDDGSTDRTSAMLRQAALHDRRIRIIRQPAQGIVQALNTGLQACSAPLTARMDGDDICHPQRLQRQYEEMCRHSQLSLVGCGVRHFPRQTLSPGMIHYQSWQNCLLTHEQILRDLYVESPFAHPSVVFRTEAVKTLGGYRAMPWAEDYDLWLRMARAGMQFARLPETLFFWRDRPSRLTRTSAACTPEAFRNCKAHFLTRGFLAGETSVTLWGAGLEGKAWRRTLLSHGIEVVRWIDIDPRRIGQRIHGAPVVAPEKVEPGHGKILVTVGSRGARPEIRRRAVALDLVEGENFAILT